MLIRTLPLYFTIAFIGISSASALAQEANPVTFPDNAPPVVYTPPATTGSGSRDVLTLTAGMNQNAMLVDAIKACGMEADIRNKSSITIFAPTNSAFQKLPPGLVEQLMKPEYASILNKIISYHIIEGSHTSASLKEAIKAAKGRAVFTTLSGNRLIATIEDNRIRLTDDGNNACFITLADLKASNGTIHIVDKVALPR